MHKFSRTLLLAGVLAFGTLSAACGDKVTVANGANQGVQLVTVTPPSATIAIGESIILSGQVTADAASAKTVAWSTSNAAVATVDQSGKVTGVKAGTASITATATADASKAASSVITVSSVGGPVAPQVSISTVNQGGVPAVLTAVANQLDVTLLATGGAGTIELFLAPAANCTTNTIAATDVRVAQQTTVASQSGPITLSFNTAAVVANAAQFPNGQYCIKSRLTTATGTAIATNVVPLTLANVNVFAGTLSFASQTNGPTTAVSTINGLNYNQGTLTATIKPVIFTSASPVALLSGAFSLVGEQAGVPVSGVINFTNVPVTNGVATITFTDTSAAGVNSIYQYTSSPTGSNLTVASATDAAGNPISIGVAAVTGATGVRIDNNMPSANGTVFNVIAPNGYIPAPYLFASGTDTTGGGYPTDVHATVPGVGGITITYYVGAAGSAAFTTANSCDITGLTAYTNTAALNNTTTTSADQAKVIIADALGNKTCLDAPSTLPGGGGLFGVDKIAPEAAYTTATVATYKPTADQTGYNATTADPGTPRGWNLTFRDSISGFPQAAGSSPFTGTLKRILSTAPVAADCVIGVWNATTKVCSATAINTTTAPTWTEEATSPVSSFLNGTFQFTNGTNVVGYYTLTLTASDVAGNTLAVAPRTAAYDNVAPGVAAPTGAAAVPLAAATVTAAATDNFDLISSRGNLVYTGLVTFARVTGNTLGAFGGFVTSATATVSLPNVYRGLQDGSTGTISATVVTPSATVTVTDVGGNSTTSAAGAISTTTASTAFAFTAPPAGTQLTLTSSAANGTSGASVATTNLTFQINGASSDAAFQSQPFTAVDIYKLNTSTGEYALVGTISAATVVDNTTTGVRTYTYALTGVALSAGPTATNTFIAVAHNAAGDAVLSPSVTQTNP